MTKRNVKTASAALARTVKPVYASDGLENVVAGLGTDRDKRQYSSWGLPRTLTRMELENMYRSSWLSKRIVNTVADDMTREWRTADFDEESETSAKLDLFEETETQFCVQEKVNEALRWARLYGGSVIVVGLRGSDNLSKPLNPETVSQGSLRYLHVMDRWRVAPSGEIDSDLQSPNFGLPLFYLLAESGIKVHWTRLIKFDGQKVPYFVWRQNGMWHDSELQHVVESLMNTDTASASIATMMFEANVDVVKSPSLTDMLSTRDGEAKLTKRFQLAAMMKSFNRMLLLDGEEEYEKKGNNFTNLADIWQQFMIDTCGAADIPMSRLFGQSAKGLNATGEGDLKNYYDKIRSDQKKQLKPQLDRLDQVLLRHTFGEVPDSYSYEFNSLWQMDDAATATMEYNKAQRDQIYLNAGVITEGLVASELKATGTYRSMTDEDVELAEELSEANAESKTAETGAAVAGNTVKKQGIESGELNHDGSPKEEPDQNE